MRRSERPALGLSNLSTLLTLSTLSTLPGSAASDRPPSSSWAADRVRVRR